MRQAFAGMLWCKQYYAYDVARWLDGDPGSRPRPESARTGATRAGGTWTRRTSCPCPTAGSTPGSRPGTWRSTPSRWRTSTRPSRSTSCCCSAREWFQHPTGALPAYEWTFDDVNPPVHAWAALHVFEIDGGTDTAVPGAHLPQAPPQLHVVAEHARTQAATISSAAASSAWTTSGPSTARTSRRAPCSSSPTPRPGWPSTPSPCCASPTACPRPTTPTPTCSSRSSSTPCASLAPWTRQRHVGRGGGLLLRRLRWPDGTMTPMRIHSMVGVIPLLPAAFVPESSVQRSVELGKHFARFLAAQGARRASRSSGPAASSRGRAARHACSPSSAPSVSSASSRELLSEDAFLSPHGLRALSARHREQPFRLEHRRCRGRRRLRAGRVADGTVRRQLELAWPGVVPAQLPGHRIAGPLGRLVRRRSSASSTPRARASRCDSARWPRTWRDASSRSGCPDRMDAVRSTARTRKLADDPEWRDLLPFHEYFHGDTGAGLGASHQTGWTGLVAHLLVRGGILDEPSDQAPGRPDRRRPRRQTPRR